MVMAMTNNEQIPPLVAPDQLGPIVTQTDLYNAWCTLLAGVDFDKRTLWLTFIDAENQMAPLLVPIDDIPEHPDSGLLDNLGHICDQVVGPTGSSAMLLSRPGYSRPSASDRIWFDALNRMATRASLRIRPIHLATNHGIRVLSVDDAQISVAE